MELSLTICGGHQFWRAAKTEREYNGFLLKEEAVKRKENCKDNGAITTWKQ